MRYNPLGRTGLFVSELCLGTMTFGGGDGHLAARSARLQQAEADALVGRRSMPASTSSTPPTSMPAARRRQITGQALKNLKAARARTWSIATKVFGETGTGPNARGASRGHILDGVKASLKRLQLDHIDLYQIHGFDPATPIEETVRALDTSCATGIVRYVGVSNWAAWQIAKALGIAERLGLARFESLQAYYTVAGRDLEREMCRCCSSEGVGLMVWSPLAGGLLSRQVRPRAAGEGGQPPRQLRLPAGRQATAPATAIDAMRAIAAGARRLGGAGRARLAAAPAAW